ncbi:hypothetical protein IJG72_02220 [bacterium]|nr:hypothetical protein [bacterium]
MTDINNDLNAIRFQKINIKKDVAKKSAAPEGCEDNIEFNNDFKSEQAAALGRSQVSKPDSLENDVKFFLKHEKFCKQSNIFFDNAYEMLKRKNEEHAYERSAQMMEAFKNEFLKSPH